jgi:hypothetical protein
MARPKGSKNKKYTALGIDAKSKEWIGFRDHRNSARARGIPFLLTFDEWLSIWTASGKFHLRGRESGCYVMARFGDRGAYVVGNVEIISHESNSSQPHWGRSPEHVHTEAWKKQHSETIKKWAAQPKVKRMLRRAGKRGAAVRWSRADGDGV